ncbi:MAG: HAD family hydrolase [Clostridium sp.]|nr:HAD family hydrolase [Clostridium sp.]
MIKYIFFDVYGTLISTETGSVDAARKILRGKNCGITAEAFYSKWKVLHRAYIDNLESFCSEEEIFESDLKALYEIYSIEGDYKQDVAFMLETLGKRKAFDDAKDVVNTLSKAFVLCIASTTDSAPLLSNLKNNDINIKHIFTSESMQVYKPRREFYIKILNALNAEPSEVLFVGDSLIDDVAGPQKLGIKTCWINRKNADSNDIKPDYIITGLTELLSLPILSVD